MSSTIFVTDGTERPALAIARSLGRRGYTVVVGSDQRVSLASTSRYCARRVQYPSPYRDRAGFERFLFDFVERGAIDVVLPVSDVTTRVVCAHQDQIRRRAALAVPPLEAFDAVSDKAALLERAARGGIPIPRTQLVSGLPRLREVLHDVEYPAVVKPTRSRIPFDGGWTRTVVHYAYSATELQNLYQSVAYLSSSPSLIQQRIVGPGIGAFMLFDRGRLTCQFGHRRLREKPPAGGVSVLRESIAVTPEIKEYATRVFGDLGWHGPVMMEFKQDDRTGQLYLMEVNGRFWGSLQLAIDAGVDFPLLVMELALGQSPRPQLPYRTGIRSRWLLGDLDHLYLRLLKRDRDLQLPPSAPSRLRTLLEFMKLCQRNTHYEVARLDDPRPFLHEIGQAIAGASAATSSAVLRALGRRTRPGVSGAAIGHAQ
jgi:predicted ATP-grasp superfamily ATP-dependent carboligase